MACFDEARRAAVRRADGVAWWIAVRYLTTRRREFATFVTRVSVAGLSLGVLVLTVVVSVMNGFDAELKRRILGTVPHVLIENVSVADPDIAALRDDPHVSSAFNFFTGDGMVTARGVVNPVTVYGLDETVGDALPMIADHMVEGRLDGLFREPRALLLGAPLAGYLGLATGDTVAIVLSDPRPTGIEPRILRYRIAGLFEVGAELDYSLAIVAMDSLPQTERAAMGVAGVRLTIDDALAAPAYAASLQRLHPAWDISSWADAYGDLFDAVRLEKVMMFLILLMVVAVAAFNIVSGQSMAVTDKRSDIAILRTMGADDPTIQRIFLLQGLVISSIGIAAGLALGVIVAHHVGSLVAGAERWFDYQLLEGTYFVEIPSVVQGADLAVIGAMSWGLCLISAWIPARRAAAMSPLAGLHS
jgi:lipoprotein-releasing system permease protein